jgi:lysophospholipid acyltransferase (LPLAT)-like uncharacterized protein
MSSTVAKPAGVVVPHVLPFYKRCGVELLCAFVRVLVATWRTKWIPTNEAAGRANQSVSPVIFCVWHNRLAMALPSYNAEVRKTWPANGLAAVVSASRDGAFLASILEHFGIQPIRGSSSRRGPQALLEATSWIVDKGYNAVITPDGPRGPCYKISDGILSLAQLTGRPIVPLAFEAKSKMKMRSWDKFQIPLPFTRCTFSFGEPIFVPRDADEVERSRIRAKLEQVMLDSNSP